MRSRRDHSAPMPLYPSEAEIARAVMGEDRAGEWPETATVLEREGLPRINVDMGGRYWPKVLEFFRIWEGHDEQDEAPEFVPSSRRIRIVPPPPDAREEPNAEAAQTYPHRRRADRHAGRARV